MLRRWHWDPFAEVQPGIFALVKRQTSLVESTETAHLLCAKSELSFPQPCIVLEYILLHFTELIVL